MSANWHASTSSSWRKHPWDSEDSCFHSLARALTWLVLTVQRDRARGACRQSNRSQFASFVGYRKQRKKDMKSLWKARKRGRKIGREEPRTKKCKGPRCLLLPAFVLRSYATLKLYQLIKIGKDLSLRNQGGRNRIPYCERVPSRIG